MLKKLFKSDKSRQLKFIIKTLEKRKHEKIRVDLQGYKKPQNVINKTKNICFAPDITSSKNGKLRVFSNITKDNLDDKDIPEKWSLFSDFAKQNNAVFHVAFPPELIHPVKKKLEDLDIEASLWDISKY